MDEHRTNIVIVAIVEHAAKLFGTERADTSKIWTGRYELIGGEQ